MRKPYDSGVSRYYVSKSSREMRDEAGERVTVYALRQAHWHERNPRNPSSTYDIHDMFWEQNPRPLYVTMSLEFANAAHVFHFPPPEKTPYWSSAEHHRDMMLVQPEALAFCGLIQRKGKKRTLLRWHRFGVLDKRRYAAVEADLKQAVRELVVQDTGMSRVDLYFKHENDVLFAKMLLS